MHVIRMQRRKDAGGWGGGGGGEGGGEEQDLLKWAGTGMEHNNYILFVTRKFLGFLIPSVCCLFDFSQSGLLPT